MKGLMNGLFYDIFFCQGPSALRKYALTAVRGLMAPVLSISVLLSQYSEMNGKENKLEVRQFDKQRIIH